jgi:Family of unknown function (DUF5677)
VSGLLIKVPESEFKPLLDRDRTLADIRDHLEPWLRLIRDITSYGTHLIPRCMLSSERKLSDAVILAILSRQIVAMLDGVEILVSSGAVYAANLPMRALFEASVYLEWILQTDTEKRAAYYYVHNLRRMRTWASRSQLGSPEWQEFRSVVSDFGIKIDDEARHSDKTKVSEIDQALSQAKYAGINKEFDEHRKGRRHDPKWYAPLLPKGRGSLGTISKAIGKESQYRLLYSGASEVMHGSNYGHHLKFADGKLTLWPIRYLQGFDLVFSFSLSTAIHTYQEILRKYRPDELSNFARKYTESWRNEFQNMPKIQYRPELEDIVEI